MDSSEDLQKYKKMKTTEQIILVQMAQFSDYFWQFLHNSVVQGHQILSGATKNNGISHISLPWGNHGYIFYGKWMTQFPLDNLRLFQYKDPILPVRKFPL